MPAKGRLLKPKVLFICLGNSCRSIIAEALTRHLCGERWDAASAGLSPLGWVAPETLEVLTEMGVDTGGLYSKGFTEVRLQDFALIINLSGYSLARVLPPESGTKVIQRPMPDPFGGSLEAYRQSLTAIKQMILRELGQGELCRPDKKG
jgi:protein-tyrosine-phosphatase